MNRLKINSLLILLVLLVSSNLLQSQNIIEGIVTYHNNNLNPLAGVTVGLYDSNDNLLMSTVTDTNGEYLLDSVPSIEFSLRVFTSDAGPGNNILDAYLIHSHINNNIILDGIHFEAADINNDGNITGYDFAQALTNVVSSSSNSSNSNLNWQFQEVSMDFSARTQERDTINLWGTSEGDVDPSWDPSGRDIDLLNSENTTPKVISSESQILTLGSDYSGNISGFQFSIEFPANIIEIINVIGPDKNIDFTVDKKNRILNVSWLNVSEDFDVVSALDLFSIEVRCFDNAAAGIENFTLLPGGMVIDSNGKIIKDIHIMLPSIEIISNIIEVNTFPNPVNSELNFSIDIPENESFNIKIFDLAGNILSDRNTSILETGNNNIVVDVNSLTQGQYFYIVSSTNGEYVLPGRFFKIY